MPIQPGKHPGGSAEATAETGRITERASLQPKKCGYSLFQREILIVNEVCIFSTLEQIMSEKYWWTSYGNFNPWSQCPSRPDPGEVLLFFLEKRGIGSEEQVSFLIDLLDLQKSMIYNILKGEGLDSITQKPRDSSSCKCFKSMSGKSLSSSGS
jgi:hypothetical protein